MSLYEVSNNNEFALSSEIIYSAWKTLHMFSQIFKPETESHLAEKNFRNINRTVAVVCKE